MARGAAMPGNYQLTALDATFLELEQADDGALMHIGAAFVFGPLPGGGVPAIGDVRAHLRQRLELLPRYGQKLDAPRTGGLAWPSWERDPRFEIEAHVRHATLSPPGEERELLSWVSDFYSHRLDRNRPLWEMVLLDGLANGRWALVTKTHHCLVDGIGSVGVADLLLDAEPIAQKPSSAHPARLAADKATGRGWLAQPPAPIRQAAGTSLAAARAGAHALMHPLEALERSREVLDLARPRRADRRAPHKHQRADRRDATNRDCQRRANGIASDPLGAWRQGQRHRALCRHRRVARTAAGAGRGVAAPGAARTGACEHPPGGTRRRARQQGLDAVHRAVGSRARPLRRYELVRAAAEKRKASGQALGAVAVLGLTELAPPVLHASLARLLYAKRLFNITITNVPGSPRRLYAFGAPALEVLPIVPLAADHALGMTAVSYAGS